MRTTIAFLFISFAGQALAQLVTKYDEGKIIFTDGKERSGLVERSLGGASVSFKANKGADAEKIDASQLKTVVYTDGDKKLEYDRIKVYLGWKQERISDYSWYEVVERGVATLYVLRSSMQGSIYNPNSKAGFLDYFVMRPGETAAKMIANVSSLNNNQTFRAKAPKYFEDYPELAKKIESKEYTWKDLVTVIQEYNKWVAAKK